MVLEDHHITWHERLIQLVGDVHGLPGCVLVRFRYDHQHVFLVKVEVPDVREYGSKLATAVQF